ncbi:phosphoglycerate dehydrogenase [Leptospirillum ferrooxidans]|uniref:D-3-phosphoglycerate dehydrogenase n=1 Tax=Leptospirillum ferrooxidans (strain C2-3) TaxID=1162668 RepID=I0INN7_LEPFC|nr:phosphoglycerate dehydrogenase [Leptospirillum ferrooxidans]BAM06886.1 D-3-phosphoglycerate dehydrogenase [Leptospirillum ferrooxidans C2-3]
MSENIRVLVSDAISEDGLKIFREAGFEVVVKTKLTPEELAVEIAGYDGLVIRSGTKVTKDILKGAKRLKVVGRAGAGLDNVDLDAATSHGIVVMNTPGGNTITTAEHTMSLLMSMARRIPQANASNRSGKWEKSKFMGVELFQKTLGIIGMGKIGQHLTQIAKGLSMHVIAFDPYLTPEVAEKSGVTPVSLDEIYQKSDFISVHTPLNAETTNLINKTTIAKMKKGVYIVNCARGGIVNETDLAEALLSGHVAGAAFDVFVQEPVPADHPLLKIDSFISTPHIGAATKEAQENVALAIADQMVDYLAKGVIRYAANLPSVSPEEMSIVTPYQKLAEIMGNIISQISSSPLSKVTIEYSGEIATVPTAAVTISALKGILSPILDTMVNEVNAPILAKERGIEVVEVRSTHNGDYTGLLSIKISSPTDFHQISGSVFQKRDYRIVSMDQLPVEVIPEPIMIYLTNQDQPGVVGAVGTILGNHKINISRMQFGRDYPGGKAISMIGVDNEISPALLSELRKIPNILSLKILHLPSAQA